MKSLILKSLARKKGKKHTKHANKWKHKFMGEVKSKDKNKSNLVCSFSPSVQVFLPNSVTFSFNIKDFLKSNLPREPWTLLHKYLGRKTWFAFNFLANKISRIFLHSRLPSKKLIFKSSQKVSS